MSFQETPTTSCSGAFSLTALLRRKPLGQAIAEGNCESHGSASVGPSCGSLLFASWLLRWRSVLEQVQEETMLLLPAPVLERAREQDQVLAGVLMPPLPS